MNIALTTSLPIKEDETVVSDLYQQLLKSWNEEKSKDFAAFFANDGSLIGFDGSETSGSEDISQNLEKIFRDHPAGKYVWKIREVRFLSPETAILRAVAGMIFPEQVKLDSSKNSIQTLIAVKQNSNWVIAMFQTTRAVLDGSPVASMELTNELNHVLQVTESLLA